MNLCFQMESVWSNVGKVSLWIRRARNVRPVIEPVKPVEDHNMTTVTPARRDSC